MVSATVSQGSGGNAAGLAAAAVAAWLASAAAVAPPSPGAAESPFLRLHAVAGWDCWIDAGERGGIRCIVDRDLPLALPVDYSDDDEAADVLLDLVHGYLHRGNPARASELVQEESHLLRRGDVWTVRLSTPPLESSWQDSRPQRLVRSLLCRGAAACTVRFHR